MSLALAPDRRARPSRTAAAPRRDPHEPPAPFTLAHFRAWAADLRLDTGDSWVLEPFQEAFIRDVFAGSAECWLVIPEGNGKTTLVAGLALYHTEFRPFAYVAVAASSRDQAQVLYQQAEGFVLRSPRLHQLIFSPVQQAKGKRKLEVPRFNPLPGYRRIDHHEGGRIQVYAADDATGDGLIPTLAILDELHRHRNLRLYQTWAGKLQKRQGQIVAISTAGEPGSEFENTRQLIRQQAGEVLRRGSFVRAASNRLVLHEWAVPEKADASDMAIVKAANPFSGITVDSLSEKFASPTMTMEHWTRFVCNVPTRSSNAAIQEVEWSRTETAEEIPVGQPISVGLDVAWKWDTTAAVPFWWRDEQFRLFGPAEVLIPPRDGTMLDGRKIEAALIGIHQRNPIATVVMDTSRAEQLGRWLETELGAEVIDWSQNTPTAALDYERFMDALRNGWLKHGPDPALKAHALNAVARVLPLGDATFDRPSSTRQGGEQDRRVIDALKAASMVHSYAVAIAAKPTEDRSPEFFTL